MLNNDHAGVVVASIENSRTYAWKYATSGTVWSDFFLNVMKISHCTDASRASTDSSEGLFGGLKLGDGKDEFQVQWSPPQDCLSAPPSPEEHKTEKVS